MSRVPMGSDGGPWAMDPETAYATSFVPQGISADLIATIEGFSREDVDLFAVESQTRAGKALADGAFARSVIPVVDLNGQVDPRPRRVRPRPSTTPEPLGGLKPSFAGDRRDGRLRRRRAAEVPLGREDQPRAHPGQLLGHRRRRRR